MIAVAAAKTSGVVAFSDLSNDILETHILTRLDGPSLASISSSSSHLHALSTENRLWTGICHSTFPSTADSSRLRRLISTFPGGPRSFFSLTCPLLFSDSIPSNSNSLLPPAPALMSELISAVDIRYRNHLIFSKVQEIETESNWFRCSPFRLDMLEPKEGVVTNVQYPKNDDSVCESIMEEMRLSWVLINPNPGLQQAANFSSYKPVSVEKHWLSGEIKVRFPSFLAGSSSEMVQCGIVVTCGASEGGELQVREVTLQVEDMDGRHLSGKESLVIVQRAMEGKRGKTVGKEEEGRKRMKVYEEKKRQRRERKMRIESTLDMLCVAFGVSLTVLALFWAFSSLVFSCRFIE
ncbi:probable F-box protein At2g36090 [Impatiens glandulifera]|uniref:probable F-box protein At2g36090 n=1 Tax=Impatiens glandulifera TaxID=253017 RepID=UPI001FB0C291|nr:probable F-box protein At2g36090 [Impatiens glandulifera]